VPGVVLGYTAHCGSCSLAPGHTVCPVSTPADQAGGSCLPTLAARLCPVSLLLQTVLGVDMFALLAYNMCGMMVTGPPGGGVQDGAGDHAHALFVWLLGLLLFYTPLGMGKLGESWTSWSYLQAAGWSRHTARPHGAAVRQRRAMRQRDAEYNVTLSTAGPVVCFGRCNQLDMWLMKAWLLSRG